MQHLELREFMVLETREQTSICIHVLVCLVWDLTLCALFEERAQFRESVSEILTEEVELKLTQRRLW